MRDRDERLSNKIESLKYPNGKIVKAYSTLFGGCQNGHYLYYIDDLKYKCVLEEYVESCLVTIDGNNIYLRINEENTYIIKKGTEVAIKISDVPINFDNAVALI